jgi:hypothetical protein
MQDTQKAQKQLIQERVALRQWLTACAAFNRQRQQTADGLHESESHTAWKQVEEALYIFDPFYTTRHLDGGTIDLASQAGHGTTVPWRLPEAPAAGGVPAHSVRQRSIKPPL